MRLFMVIEEYIFKSCFFYLSLRTYVPLQKNEKCEQEDLIDAPDIDQFKNSSIYENKKELIVY